MRFGPGETQIKEETARRKEGRNRMKRRFAVSTLHHCAWCSSPGRQVREMQRAWASEKYEHFSPNKLKGKETGHRWDDDKCSL
jgi:hypothetical protein